MTQAVVSDVKELVLGSATFGPQEVDQIVAAIADDMTKNKSLREAVQELEAKADLSPALKTRLGVCQYLLGRHRSASNTLTNADGSGIAHFYLGKTQAVLENHAQALDAYAAAAKAGYNSDLCALARADATRCAGDAKAALAILDRLSGAVEQTAEYLYQRACTVSAIGGNPQEVVALYERAVEADPKHSGALFGLAMENDRRGNDETALNLYERSNARLPAHVGSLLNLGILYEDRNQFDSARRCYQRILEAYPNHPRARLFLKDAQASSDMFYDEDAQRKRDRLSQVLSVPVTDFELSVRSRNCLQKMGIMTLGDLTNTSEQELLASKNFGETSLVEIREMMASKGLELGQFAGEKQRPEVVEFEPQNMSADERALLESRFPI